jgi:glycerophosphoryl diester phosphodiesterase
VVDRARALGVSVWSTQPPGSLVVGHRGGRGPGWPPENTILAFEHARRQGAPAVELDVRTCAGGGLVVVHDATLSNASEGRDGRRVCDAHRSELRAMGVPTLEEALSWARASRVAVNVEMKHDVADRAAFVRATVHAVRASGADVLLSSFDPLLLAIAAVLAPSLPRALLVRAGQPLWERGLQRAARSPFVGWLHLERTQVHPSVLARHLAKGLRLGVWTVNDPREAVDLVRLGVASIITDAPGAVLQALTGN